MTFLQWVSHHVHLRFFPTTVIPEGGGIGDGVTRERPHIGLRLKSPALSAVTENRYFKPDLTFS